MHSLARCSLAFTVMSCDDHLDTTIAEFLALASDTYKKNCCLQMTDVVPFPNSLAQTSQIFVFFC